jgi:CRP/FNR family transcriptional regulator, cyclic AMP receptor protein
MAKHSRGRIAALRRLAPFAACTQPELILIDALTTGLLLPAGEVLTKEGNVGRQCFLVEGGTVGLSRSGQDLALAGPGDWVGELDLLDGTRRTVTATTLTPTTVSVLDRREFASLLAQVPSVAERVRAGRDRRGRLRDASFPPPPPRAGRQPVGPTGWAMVG